jgi:hypothetical protein
LSAQKKEKAKTRSIAFSAHVTSACGGRTWGTPLVFVKCRSLQYGGALASAEMRDSQASPRLALAKIGNFCQTSLHQLLCFWPEIGDLLPRSYYQKLNAFFFEAQKTKYRDPSLPRLRSGLRMTAAVKHAEQQIR